MMIHPYQSQETHKISGMTLENRLRTLVNENERLQDQVKSPKEESNIYKQEQDDAAGRA